LRRILDLELAQVQQRILLSSAEKCFVLTVSNSAKELLLQEGTNLQYGARHLKRTIWEFLVHPVSNLIATNQVRTGDWIQADLDTEHRRLVFTPEAEGLELHAMASMMGEDFRLPQMTAAAAAPVDQVKTISAKSSKK
jgi:ATP-dependent Clp protease ATP-binding subunit ClpA